MLSWGNQTANGLWDDRVKDAVAAQLAAKGLTEVLTGGDVVVAARNAIHNQQELNTFYDGFGGRRWGGGMGMSTTTVDNGATMSNYRNLSLVPMSFTGSSLRAVDKPHAGLASASLSRGGEL